jgi:hypothetical protein
MKINHVTYKEIESLTDIMLSKLLLSLLNNEAKKYKFLGVKDIIVPLKINIGDGGEDGRVECDDTNGSTHIPCRFTLFQNKATGLTPGQVYSEFFSINIPDAPEISAAPGKASRSATTRQLVLKDRIKEVLDAGGQYVFFIGHNYNTGLRTVRLNQAKKALSNYNDIHGTEYKPEQVRIIEANDIANWANEFINSLILVQSANGIERVAGLQLLLELAEYASIREVAFHSNETLDGFISQIQQNIAQDRSSLRIIGHSGLGKTRLVYEAIKASGAIDQAVYFAIFNDGQPIVDFTKAYCKSLEGILVIDNCSYEIHKLLKDEINRTGSTFKLITIDYDVSEEGDRSKTSQEQYIFLNNSHYIDIVKNILNDQFQGKLDRNNINQIAEYSEGYPGMAVLFAGARLQGNIDLSDHLSLDVIKRLAFGRDWPQNDEVKFNVLTACSVFSSFGRPGTRSRGILTVDEKQFFLNQQDFIAQSICEPSKTSTQFMQATDYFEERRVLERRGNYLSAKPTPLAVKLAIQWWKYIEPDRLKLLFPELERLGLAIPLVNRLAELDQVSEAKDIVNELWGSNSPFGSAEVLNTELGSRLFRSVAPVNPEAAVSALEDAFSYQKIDELKYQVGPGRRYIIWTLEALAFRKDYFERSIALLFRFAAAENENISNNATGQLLQMFHIVLAGTEADLHDRLAAIDSHLNDKSPQIKHLAVKALMSGLKGDNFMRTDSVEKQGSSIPLKDFIPTWGESADYWTEIMKRLLLIARENPDERGDIKGAIARSIRNLFRNNLSTLVKEAIIEILSYDISYWEEAINQLNATNKYEVINEEEKELVKKLIGLLQPQSLADQVKYYVSAPVWNFESKIGKGYVDHGAIMAEKYAEQVSDGSVDLTELIPFLLKGEQRKGYFFGKKLAELHRDSTFAYQMLEKLKELPQEEANAIVPAAYVSALDKKMRLKIIDYMIADSLLAQYALYFTSIQEPEVEEIEKLFVLLDTNQIQVFQFYQFGYGKGLDLLSEEQALNLFTKLAEYPNAEVTVLELSLQYIDSDEDRWLTFRTFIRSLILKTNFSKLGISSQVQYSWYNAVEKLLKTTEDPVLMETLVKQMVELGPNDRISTNESYQKLVAKHIMTKDFDLFWRIMGSAVLDNSTYFSFKFFLGSKNGEYGTSGLLDHADYNKLVQWAKENMGKAPKRLASMMPITLLKDATTWHPLAVKVIDEFGALPGVMAEVSANIHSFGSIGSQVPYLEDQMTLISKMLKHQTAEVRVWAKSEVDNLKIIIERTKLDDESEFITY